MINWKSGTDTKKFYEEDGKYFITKEACYTSKCPSWIKINPDKMNVSINGRRNQNKRAEGIYIYLLAFRDVETNNIQHYQTVVITVKYKKTRPPKGKRIRINMPWNLWLKQNKGKLPYAVDKVDTQIKAKRSFKRIQRGKFRNRSKEE